MTGTRRTAALPALGLVAALAPVLGGSLPAYALSCTGLVGVAAGATHSLARRSDGTVLSWGASEFGQLGDGTTTNRSTPVQVTGLTGAVAIAAGGAHSLALRDDGTVWAWGWNAYGQLGDTTTVNRSTPVQVTGLTDAVAIAAGGAHSLALRDDGTVWAWGLNSSGELGDGTTTSRTAPVRTAELVGVAALAGGYTHSLAVDDVGTVWAWGANGYGQLGDGTTTNRSSPVPVGGVRDIAGVSAGHAHSVAVRDDGMVWTWGANGYGQLGDGTTVGWSTPVQVSGLDRVVEVAAGDFHVLAARGDGTVRAWGNNRNGQLGDGTTTHRRTPVTVSGLSGAVGVAGYTHSLALGSDGTARSWGWNGGGQLGDGTTVDRGTPVPVDCGVAPPPAPWRSVGPASVCVGLPRAASPPAVPRKQAFFNDPPGGNTADERPDPDPDIRRPDSEITTRLVEIINAAVPGATIRIAMYFITDDTPDDHDPTTTKDVSEVDKLVNALCNAMLRGVQIRLVVDNEYTDDADPGNAVTRIANLDGTAESVVQVRKCQGACFTIARSRTPKMHNKFLLVDDTDWNGGAKEFVVAQSSANWSDKQLWRHYHNDLLVIWDDAALYDVFDDYWEALWDCAADQPACDDRPPEGGRGDTDTYVHFSPQDWPDDPQETEIEHVSCAGGNKRIAISMGSWGDDPIRGDDLADLLDEKQDAGCDVRILVPEDEKILDELAAHNLDHRCFGDGKLDDPGDHSGPGVHTKQILVDATYDEHPDSRIVFTGSTNFTYNALRRGDEAWLKVAYEPGGLDANLRIYEDYRARFDALWNEAFPCS